jgi:hypothetical protein
MEIPHLSLATQELNWYGSDREEIYQQNLKTNLASLTRHKILDQTITYKFNNHGFRADEFESPGKNIMFVGCSHTLGVGVPYESTWAYTVSNSLKLKNYNLGLGGTSNDTAFRLAYHWIDQLNPEIVIFLSTERTRSELHTINNDIEDLSVRYIDVGGFPDATPYMRHWFGNDINGDMNYLKNTMAIKQLCNDRNIKCLHREALTIHEVDKARDLQHFGIKTHRRIAAMFLSRL